MKSDFLLAITQLSAEKNLPKEVVLGAVEAALVSAYRKEHFTPHQNLEVKVDPGTGQVSVWAEKIAVESVTDNRREISLTEARKVNKDINIDDPILVEATPHNAGRIAAQTAKQVILQRLHEAEHSAIFEEYADKENDIITGIVQRVEPKQLYVNLGRTEALLPSTEQVPTERYRLGQRLKVFLLEVNRTVKGPKVIVSRSHPNLLKRLFELEVPEVYNGIVEIKSVAREAGYRSKVAVVANQEGIDPVGCCVGLRGIRIQNIVNELNGEKIDVVIWSPDESAFISNALSPAQVASVKMYESVATVVVPDRQLSLAIGKDGQNARLAARLTGWRIDIKSVSAAEAERLTEKEEETEEVKAASKKKSTAVKDVVAEAETVTEEQPVIIEEEILVQPEAIEEEILPDTQEISLEEEGEALVSEEELIETGEIVEELSSEIEEEMEPVSVLATDLEDAYERPARSKSQIRFAEDIFVTSPYKPSGGKSRKKKKKGAYHKERGENERPKKQRDVPTVSTDADDE